ncbi:hypothetical protein XENORESO_005539, partial [Xenotaenia resolanae]
TCFETTKRNQKDVWTRKDRRQSQSQGQDSLVPCWSPVPSGPCSQAAEERKLRRARRCRSSSLPGRGAGVPHRRDPGAGRKRGPRQQEDQDHPPPPAAGRPQRRGAEQAAGRSHHRSGWRPPQHPGCAAAQEDREARQGQVELLGYKNPTALLRATHICPNGKVSLTSYLIFG